MRSAGLSIERASRAEDFPARGPGDLHVGQIGPARGRKGAKTGWRDSNKSPCVNKRNMSVVLWPFAEGNNLRRVHISKGFNDEGEVNEARPRKDH